MVIVLGEFRIPPENCAKAVAATERVVTASRAEAGCLSYSYGQDVIDPGLFRVSEQWLSREALTVHFTVPHMKVWQQEREALGMSGRKVSAFTVSGEEAL
jgi:quinol monooxygenase YgiN